MTWHIEDHWISLLDQDEAWQDAQNVRHRLDDMEPGYCRRVAAFILRQANEVVDLLTEEFAACREPDTYQAQIDYERGLSEFFYESSDPTAWLRQRPLLIALNRRAEGKPARPTLCHCGYEIQSDWDHSNCYPGIIVD